MEKLIITVEVLKDANELWQMENAFLNAVGESSMDEAAQLRLAKAIAEEKIIFFTARQNERMVGLCSVSPGFSTFACKPCGVFDDFYILPEFRKQGIARLLVEAARTWCREHDYASLTVGCASRDAVMYQSLGFDTCLGVLLANNL